MIGRLAGRLDEVFEGGCILDVNGVGYLLSCSRKTLDRLAAAPEAARVLVETQVRQDSIVLHGFSSREERDAFRRLTAIQGVGPKVALDLLSALEPTALAEAVRGGDRASLRQANGVGAKLADRLVTELRDWAGGVAPSAPVAGAAPIVADADSEAVSALTNLGWKRPEAAAAIARARARDAAAPLTALIRDALRELGAARG